MHESSSRIVFPVLAIGLLLSLALSGCAGSGMDTRSGMDTPGSTPGDGDTATVDPASLRQLQELLGKADTLMASSFHCLVATGAVCGESATAPSPGTGGGDDVGVPEDDGTVSMPNDGTAGGDTFERIEVPFDCEGDTCTAVSPHEGEIAIADIKSLLDRAGSHRIAEIGGVNLVEFTAATASGETTVWGGWLGDVFFGVKGDGSRPLGQEGPLSELALQAVAAGTAEATRPSPTAGSATWTGAMVGRSADPAAGPVWASVKGEAEIKVDFGDNEVDVQFRNITNSYNEAWRVPNIGWTGLPMSVGGRLQGRNGNDGRAVLRKRSWRGGRRLPQARTGRLRSARGAIESGAPSLRPALREWLIVAVPDDAIAVLANDVQRRANRIRSAHGRVVFRDNGELPNRCRRASSHSRAPESRSSSTRAPS